MSYKNQDRSWRRGSWCGLHLTLNAESLGGGSVSRYSGKLVRTLSALEQYFHRKTTRMVATVLKIPNIISFCQAKATWPLLRTLPIKTFLQFCSIYVSFLELRIHQCSWHRVEHFGIQVQCMRMDSKLVWSRNGMSHCGEGGGGGGEEAVVWRDQIKAAMKTNINYELIEWLNDSCHCLL